MGVEGRDDEGVAVLRLEVPEERRHHLVAAVALRAREGEQRRQAEATTSADPGAVGERWDDPALAALALGRLRVLQVPEEGGDDLVALAAVGALPDRREEGREGDPPAVLLRANTAAEEGVDGGLVGALATDREGQEEARADAALAVLEGPPEGGEGAYPLLRIGVGDPGAGDPGHAALELVLGAPQERGHREKITLGAACPEGQEEREDRRLQPARAVAAADVEGRPQLLAVAELAALPVEEGEERPVLGALELVLAADVERQADVDLLHALVDADEERRADEVAEIVERIAVFEVLAAVPEEQAAHRLIAVGRLLVIVEGDDDQVADVLVAPPPDQRELAEVELLAGPLVAHQEGARGPR